MFYQGGPKNDCTHVIVPVDQYSAKSEFNSACTARISLAHFRISNNDLIRKHIYVVPEHAPLIILDTKSAVCMTKNGKETKQTRHISRRIHFVIKGEEGYIHKKVWCEGVLQC